MLTKHSPYVAHYPSLACTIAWHGETVEDGGTLFLSSETPIPLFHSTFLKHHGTSTLEGEANTLSKWEWSHNLECDWLEGGGGGSFHVLIGQHPLFPVPLFKLTLPEESLVTHPHLQTITEAPEQNKYSTVPSVSGGHNIWELHKMEDCMKLGAHVYLLWWHVSSEPIILYSIADNISLQCVTLVYLTSEAY